MNRYPDRVTVNTAPGVQTVAEVVEDTVPIVSDGIKDYDIIFMIDKLFLVDHCQTLQEPNVSNTAITLKIKKAEVNRFLSMINAGKLTIHASVITIRNILLDRLSASTDHEWVSFMRKDISALAILRSSLEKYLVNINNSAVLSRMLFLPVANSEFASRPDRNNIASTVDILNSDGTRDGTRLLENALSYTPGEIGCLTQGTLVKSADISLESKGNLRQVLQNQSHDLINDEAINAIDSFCGPEIAVLPLTNNKYVLKLAELRYKREGKKTFDTDKKLLNYEASVVGQDWYSAFVSNTPTPPIPSIENESIRDVKAGDPNLASILKSMWAALHDTSLSAQEPADYLIEFGVQFARKSIEKIFPPFEIKKGVFMSLVDYIPEILRDSPLRFWEINAGLNGGTPVTTDVNKVDIIKTYTLFLKCLVLNYAPNLVRLGKYYITNENIATETIRTVLGGFSDEYMDYIQGRVSKEKIPASIILSSR